MNPLMDAIKNKRGGGKSSDVIVETETEPKSLDTGMKDLASQLSDDQKQELLEILTGSEESPEGESKAQDIAKGAPSMDEKKQIQAKMQEQAPDDMSEADSDSIAMDMLDSKFKREPQDGMQPRNLSERVKMGIASKLRSKGKL